jgi:hypothetical protein
MFTFEIDSENALLGSTLGTLGPTVELVASELEEKGNFVHSSLGWHSQSKESELSEACAARHFQKTQIEFPNLYNWFPTFARRSESSHNDPGPNLKVAHAQEKIE